MNGKGSKRRPCLIPQKDFQDNWDRVFLNPEPTYALGIAAAENQNGTRIPTPDELTGHYSHQESGK
jgi:hypothetical protein